MRAKTTFRRVLVAAALSSVGLTLAAPQAGAQSLNGWIGPAQVNGQSYLHYSTISNTPLFADTRMYTAFGFSLPAYYMGVRSRLFLSGALCSIAPATYNTTPASSITGPTSGPDCGPGWYNSHGFALAKDTNGFQQLVTFPTDPLYFPEGAPAAAAVPDDAAQLRTTPDGRSIGSGAEAQSDSELPDLVLSYGNNGELGYVKSGDITALPASEEDVSALPVVTLADGTRVAQTPATTVPLYAEDGTTVIGDFTIGG